MPDQRVVGFTAYVGISHLLTSEPRNRKMAAEYVQIVLIARSSKYPTDATIRYAALRF